MSWINFSFSFIRMNHRSRQWHVPLRKLTSYSSTKYGKQNMDNIELLISSLKNNTLKEKHVGSTSTTKIAWDFMSQNSLYDNRIANESNLFNILKLWKLQMEKSESSSGSAVSKFITLSSNLEFRANNIEDKSHMYWINMLVDEIQRINFHEIICCLSMLSKWNQTTYAKSPNFYAIWSALDERSCQILPTLSTKEILFIADCWFQLKLNSLANYNRKMLQILINDRLQVLTSSEYVQMMFYASFAGDMSLPLGKKVERKFLQIIEPLSMPELMIVSHCFFKNNYSYQTMELLQCLMNKTIENIEIIDDTSLITLLKSFRKATQHHRGYDIGNLIKKFLLTCENHIEKISSNACVDLILLTPNNNVYIESLVSQILARCAADIKCLQIINISHLVFVAGLFYHTSSQESMSVIQEEVKRRLDTKEIEKNSKFLIKYLLSLSYLEIFDKDVLNFVFSEKFLTKSIIGPNTDWYVLDCNVQLECDSYQGNRLPAKIAEDKQNVLASTADSSSRDSKYFNNIKYVVAGLEEIYKTNQGITVKRILPHYILPDIFVCIDDNGKVQPNTKIPEQMMPVSGAHTWLCFLVGSRNMYTFHHRQPTGNICTKFRQLTKLGYKVIEIPYFELVPDDANQNSDLLRRKIDLIKS